MYLATALVYCKLSSIAKADTDKLRVVKDIPMTFLGNYVYRDISTKTIITYRIYKYISHTLPNLEK